MGVNCHPTQSNLIQSDLIHEWIQSMSNSGLHATDPQYLSDLFTLTVDLASRRHLLPVCLNGLFVPCHKLSTFHFQPKTKR